MENRQHPVAAVLATVPFRFHRWLVAEARNGKIVGKLRITNAELRIIVGVMFEIFL